MEDFKSITVTSGPIVRVKNPTSYPLVGKGSQGAVFKLDPDRCVKIYENEKNAELEAQAYRKSQGSPIIPRLYEAGPNYIIIEYLNGPSLKEYIQAKGSISKSMTRKILLLFEEIKSLGFPRLDWALRHIFLTRAGELKVIDILHAFKNKRPGPITLFSDFKDLGLLAQFLENVKEIDIQTYSEWKEMLGKYFE